MKTTSLSGRVLDRPAAGELLGRVHDIGAGGLCMLSDQMVTVPQLLRCDILLPGMSVGVPTLVRVRWCAKDPRRAGYRAGVEFLLG